MEQFTKRSPITGRKYDYFSKDNIHLINIQQSFFYINEMGIVPLDIVLADDKKRKGKKILMFIFSKSETQEAYKIWLSREHYTEEINKDE